MANKNRSRLVATLFSFNDLLWALLACFMLMTALLITQIQKSKVESKTEEEKPAGSISVYVFWPDGIDLDIDLHLSDPAGEHIYFGKLSGKIWNLLRDDLGMMGDLGPRNFENAYARGLPMGDYVVNVHAYRGSSSLYPVTVEGEVRITANPAAGKGSQIVVNQKIVIYRTSEEVTLVRFSIDAKGRIIPGSVNHIFKRLIGSM